jgi:Spy/CpxP family protein refolding chaperone
MKSAYELAMERLQKAAPAVKLTEDQKAQLAEIDSQFRAKIAEKELFLKGEIGKAIGAGKFDEVEKLQQQLATQTRRLEEDRESKKEKLRASFVGPTK